MEKNKDVDIIDMVHKKDILRRCGNADHLSDVNGDFISDMPHGNGKTSIGYLEDVCQWLYYHNNLTNIEKLKKILDIESIIKEQLGCSNIVKGGIGYIPTWSKMLNDEIKKNI